MTQTIRPAPIARSSVTRAVAKLIGASGALVATCVLRDGAFVRYLAEPIAAAHLISAILVLNYTSNVFTDYIVNCGPRVPPNALRFACGAAWVLIALSRSAALDTVAYVVASCCISVAYGTLVRNGDYEQPQVLQTLENVAIITTFMCLRERFDVRCVVLVRSVSATIAVLAVKRWERAGRLTPWHLDLVLSNVAFLLALIVANKLYFANASTVLAITIGRLVAYAASGFKVFFNLLADRATARSWGGAGALYASVFVSGVASIGLWRGVHVVLSFAVVFGTTTVGSFLVRVRARQREGGLQPVDRRF